MTKVIQMQMMISNSCKWYYLVPIFGVVFILAFNWHILPNVRNLNCANKSYFQDQIYGFFNMTICSTF